MPTARAASSACAPPSPPRSPCTSPSRLPLDPRAWGRREVRGWVRAEGGRPERFPMNGKALCLMSERMFAAREPLLGARLHRDFGRRLAKALALQELLERLAAGGPRSA